MGLTTSGYYVQGQCGACTDPEEVLPPPSNIPLLNKPTAQSSTYANGKSSRAIDGNTDAEWSGGSCTHTLRTSNPWWRVDLQQDVNVYSVQVWNRGDCCGSRLAGFKIEVGDSAEPEVNPDCGGGASHTVAQGSEKTIPCQFLRGRYVHIVRVLYPTSSTGVLTLCEVSEPAC